MKAQAEFEVTAATDEFIANYVATLARDGIDALRAVEPRRRSPMELEQVKQQFLDSAFIPSEQHDAVVELLDSTIDEILGISSPSTLQTSAKKSASSFIEMLRKGDDVLSNFEKFLEGASVYVGKVESPSNGTFKTSKGDRVYLVEALAKHLGIDQFGEEGDEFNDFISELNSSGNWEDVETPQGPGIMEVV